MDAGMGLYMTETVADISTKCRPVFAKNNIARAGLFGSYARGEQTPKSDLDFVVEFRGRPSLFTLGQVKYELEQVLGKECDVLTYSSLEKDTSELSRIIQSEVRVIYADS